MRGRERKREREGGRKESGTYLLTQWKFYSEKGAERTFSCKGEGRTARSFFFLPVSLFLLLSSPKAKGKRKRDQNNPWAKGWWNLSLHSFSSFSLSLSLLSFLSLSLYIYVYFEQNISSCPLM